MTVAKKKGRPPIDLREKVSDILTHTEPLGPEALSPIRHYRRAVAANSGLNNYIDDHLSGTSHYPAIKAQHMGHLRRLVLANLIEAFERFIKELAAVCIDQLSRFVTDDRYNTFTAKGNEIVAHFEAGSIGKALCESDTWLSNDQINQRFRKLLAPSGNDPWDDYLLPARNQGKKGPLKEVQEKRAAILAILWQIRHNLTHNSGVLTGSDSMKFRALTRRLVEKDQQLVPSEVDLRYVTRFLSETADDINRRVATQLAELLGAIHGDGPSLFDAAFKAQELANIFDLGTTLATAHAEPVYPS